MIKLLLFILFSNVLCAYPRELNVEQCINIALKNNRFIKISEIDTQISKARKSQADSALYPNFSGQIIGTIMDQNPIFVFPQEKMLGVNVPEKKIKIMDNKLAIMNLGIMQILYSGGLISSYRNQARHGIEISKTETLKTSLKVIYDVKKYYWSAILSKKLFKITDNLFKRLQIHLELAEKMYKGGTGKVTKRDFLKTKMMVNTVESLRVEFEMNLVLAKKALINTIGEEFSSDNIMLSDEELPFDDIKIDEQSLLSELYQFNPDWKKIEHAMKVFESQVNEAESIHLPKIGVFGTMRYLLNSYDKGMVPPENKLQFMGGVGIDIPIFSGLFGVNKVREAKYKLSKIKQQKLIFISSIATKIRVHLKQLKGIGKKTNILNSNLKTSKELTSLNLRAYQANVGELKDVIEARIIEGIVNGNLQKVKYDYLLAKIELENTIGKEIEKKMENAK